MKQLIIVRHGDYKGDGHLSDQGKKQISQLTFRLKSLLNGDAVTIMSSTAPRAIDSAEIISNILGKNFEKHEILWSGGSRTQNHEAVLNLLGDYEEEADTIILVTHYEYVKEFPKHFAARRLDTVWAEKTLDKGEACVINCKEKNLWYLHHH